ncbi:MAG TPA: Flp pilus assembly protein CpaB [Solimonas sp.]
MSSTALKVVAVIAVLLAIALAVIGFQISKSYATKADQAQEQVRQQQVEQFLAVVAVKPLSAYKPIARDTVALVPVSVRPADPYTNLEDVVGKVPLVDVDAGAPVTQRYFKEGNVLARIIPPGFQAVSVEINDVVAVGGFVRPGDVVDLLLFLRGGAGLEQPQSRVLLEGVRVLAYEERIIDRPEGLKGDDEASRRSSRVRTAVLAVRETDTTKLMLGASLGDLRLALHSQNTAAVAEDGAAGADAGATAKADATRSEKAISLDELARLKPLPTRQGDAPPPQARIEVIRGAQRETVTTK